MINQREYLLIYVATTLFALLSVQEAWATPPPQLCPNMNYEFWSQDKNIYVIADYEHRIITAFELRNNKINKGLWQIPKVYRQIFLSSGGNCLIGTHELCRFIDINFDPNETMVWFYNRGELVKTVKLSEIIEDYSKLKNRRHHYEWGRYRGIDSTGLFVVETLENKILKYSPCTGKLIESKSTIGNLE